VHNPVNPVRGEAVVGVAVDPDAAGVKSEMVEVWLPDRFQGQLQVETLTADGRFRGEGAFEGEAEGGRWVTLPLSSPAARPGDPFTLAVAIRGPGDVLFAARWGSAPPKKAVETIRLYVNSRRADMFVRAGKSFVRCSPVKIPQPVRFDAVCNVRVADMPADGVLTLIRRDQFDEQEQTITVRAGGIR
jgi:hypothetical protein